MGTSDQHNKDKWDYDSKDKYSKSDKYMKGQNEATGYGTEPGEEETDKHGAGLEEFVEAQPNRSGDSPLQDTDSENSDKENQNKGQDGQIVNSEDDINKDQSAHRGTTPLTNTDDHERGSKGGYEEKDPRQKSSRHLPRRGEG